MVGLVLLSIETEDEVDAAEIEENYILYIKL